MTIIYIITAVAGIAATWAGFVLSHRLKKPWDTLAAFLVPAGIIMALVSALVIAVPGFFNG